MGGSTAERMRITSTGNVGIGTTNPASLLQVYATTSSAGGNTAMFQAPNIGSSASWIHYGTTGDIYWRSAATTGKVTLQDSGGNVGIGTGSPSYMLHVNGSVAGVGAYNALSDIRYKKDVQSLAHSLAKILAIRGVTYKWIDEDKYGGQTQIGVIAQEIEKIVPEVVTTGSDGVKRVKYADLIPLVIEAMQEQNAELELLKTDSARKDEAIERLNADTAQLRADNSQIKAESAQLKSFICAQFPTAPMCK